MEVLDSEHWKLSHSGVTLVQIIIIKANIR